MMFGSEAKIQIQELLDLITLGEDVCSAVNGAESFKVECGEVGKRAHRLSEMLETLYCFITFGHTTSLYLRPLNCIVAKVRDNFELAKTMVYKSKRRSLFGRLFTSCNATDFGELFRLLDASISDMEWLLIVYDPQRSRAIGPINKKMCTTFCVWSCIATVQMGRELEVRIEAASFLALLAQEKDEFKSIIFEEGGVPPLQKLLKENSPDAQIMAANALCLLANEQERMEIIMKQMIYTIINRLSRTSPISDQIQAANLVANIAEHYTELKEYHLIRENVMWRLVTLLSSEPSEDDPSTDSQKLRLKISCSKALWMLAMGSVGNCRTLTETKGMLCLAKLVETEQDELRYNCLMIIREITAIAESDNDFRHSTFKSTSPAAKAVVDELLRAIKEFDDTKLRIQAIKSIGSLARCFSAKEIRVISPLVARLDNKDQEVATQAAIALEKFVCTDNYLCFEHSKSIIDFNGVPLLMKLLDGHKKSQAHGLSLICYLAKHDSNSNVLIKAGALTALETKGRLVAAEHSELKDLVSDAISILQSNHADTHVELDSSTKGSITEITVEQSKAALNSLRHDSNKLLEGLTGFAEKLVNLQCNCKASFIVIRCKKRFFRALTSSKTRRILPPLMTPRHVKDYPGDRLLAMEVAQKPWLMKNIVHPLAKEVIRRKFGYIIHKFCKNLICKYC